MRNDIRDTERAILRVNGAAKRWLVPGRHRIIAWLNKLEVVRFDTTMLLVNLHPSEAALAPADEVKALRLGEGQRAVIRHGGKAVRWLGAGLWHVWIVDPAVSIDVLDTTTIATRPLQADVARVVDRGDYLEITVPAGHVAARYVDGALVEVCKPGRHAAWTTRHKVRDELIDLRERLLQVAGQDVIKPGAR